ncbi:MAG: hypothetical protein ACYC42_08220 [Lysobacter sp.]
MPATWHWLGGGAACALCGCVVAPIGEDEDDRRLLVRFDGNRATLIDTRVP